VVSVMIAESNGSNPITVMSVPGHSAEPAWSPDGTTLAITPVEPVLHPLQVVPAQAGAQPVTLVGEGNPSSPSWQPDGSKLAFTWTPPGESDSDIYLIAPDGTGLAPFSASGASEFDPSWAPDGSALAMVVYGGGFQLYVVNRAGTQTRRLTDDTLIKSRPTWGPAQ
jgi:TolB protein